MPCENLSASILGLIKRMDSKLKRIETELSENLPKCLPKDLLETLSHQHNSDVAQTNKARVVLGELLSSGTKEGTQK